MLGLLGVAKRFLPALPYALIALLAALAWHFDQRAVANADMIRTQAMQFKQAQADTTAIAQAALKHQEAVYQAKAQENDNAYQAQLADARSAADRYITTHRVQPAAPAGDAGTTAAGAQGGSAAIPASLPTDAVVVSGSDVQVCTDAVTYALKAHEWANSINP
jgi:hypothetical protein